MEYLVRLAQCHETFRRPELQAVATLLGIEMEIIAYNEFVCIFPNRHSGEILDEKFSSLLSNFFHHPCMP
jgi:tRNA G10  N-methylase Trm11